MSYETKMVISFLEFIVISIIVFIDWFVFYKKYFKNKKGR